MMIHCHENFRSSKTETLLFWPCSMSHGYIVQNFHTTYIDFITCNSNRYIQKWVVQNNNSLCYFLCESKCICTVIFLTSSQSHWATQVDEVELAVWFGHGAFVLSAEPINLQPNTFKIKMPNQSKYYEGSHRGAVGWGTALQVGRLWVWFPVVYLEFFIDIILPAALWPWSWLSL